MCRLCAHSPFISKRLKQFYSAKNLFCAEKLQRKNFFGNIVLMQNGSTSLKHFWFSSFVSLDLWQRYFETNPIKMSKRFKNFFSNSVHTALFAYNIAVLMSKIWCLKRALLEIEPTSEKPRRATCHFWYHHFLARSVLLFMSQISSELSKKSELQTKSISKLVRDLKIATLVPNRFVWTKNSPKWQPL